MDKNIQAIDLRALNFAGIQRVMSRTILLLVMLFLLTGVVEKLKAVDNQNSFQSIYNTPEILQFEGEQSYTADQIRKSLSNSAEYWSVAYRNLPAGDYLASVRRLIRAGYLHGGFPDIQISVLGNEDNSFLVRIKEGQRYTCGDIIIKAVKTFKSYDDLRQNITSPPVGDESPFVNVQWIKGEPAPMDEALNPINFSKNIDRFLSDLGVNLKCKVTIKPQKEKPVADMHVSLSEYNPTHIVSEIVITGSKKNSKEEILHYLQIKEGVSCYGLEARLDKKLLESARFLAHEIWYENDAKNSNWRKLHIQLRDYDNAPPLGQKFSKEEEGVMRFFEQLQKRSKWDKDLVLEISTEGMGADGTDLLKKYLAPLISSNIEIIKLKIILSNNGIFVSLHEANSSEEGNLIAVVSYSKNIGFGLNFPMLNIKYQSRKLAIPNSPGGFKIIASFLPTPEPNEDGRDFHLLLGAVASANIQSQNTLKDIFDINIAPVASIHLLKGQGASHKITDQYLKIKNSNKNLITTATIDLVANTLVSLNVRDAMTSNNLLSGSMQSGALDEYIKNIITETNSLPNNYDPNNKFGSLLATIVQIASVFITSEKLNGDIENRTEILSRLAAKCGLLLKKKMGLDKEDGFDLGKLDWSEVKLIGGREIPIRNIGQKNSEKIIQRLKKTGSTNGNISNPFYEIISMVLFQFKDDLFMAGSWPWTMCVKSMTINERDLIYSEEYLIDFCKSTNIGPVGCAVVTYILANSQSEKAKDTALKGLGKMNADQFKKDCLPIFENDSALYELLTEVFRFYAELEPQEKKLLLDALEAISLPTETILEIDQYPEKTILEILDTTLSSLWEKVFKDIIKDYLYSVVFSKTGS